MTATRAPAVIAGISRAHPDVVAAAAAELARRFGAELVCASVNESRHEVAEAPDGTVTSMSFNPDLVDRSVEVFDPTLKTRLAAIIDSAGVPWSTRALAGDPAHALAHLAQSLDAAMIVVGTRQASMRGNVHEFFTGSVAVHLAHRQGRPIVVIPVSPAPGGETLPWESK